MHRYERGTVGMADSGKDTAGSQFFITHTAQPHLNGRYVIVGKVTRGMAVVDVIEEGDTFSIRVIE
jgi:cyclophilin family peptidyl-prolyl cis-trans isomerase